MSGRMVELRALANPLRLRLLPLTTDIERWAEPAARQAIQGRVKAVSDRRHLAARTPETTGTVRLHATMVPLSIAPDR